MAPAEINAGVTSHCTTKDEHRPGASAWLAR